MKLLSSLICILGILHFSYAPPVSPDKSKEHDSEIKDDLEEYMEYHRYLKEVVQALESDTDFRERLEKADEDDVRSGKIAEQLDFVNHNVRTKLDEIKRRELERLRHLATKQYELTHDLNTNAGKVSTDEHLDNSNLHTFEIEDLKRLIRKTTADLEAADKQRKEEFKEYEMEKQFEKHQKMENMDENQKKEYMDKVKEEENAKKHHEPLHHPGSKQQLEEVWEKQDHMDQQFDPKVFFMTHDVDGNGVWDADEVKALFIKELDKVYGPGGPNKDLHERAEEMERMREHVFQENDINGDGLIDLKEFMQETQKADFNKDEGWKSIDENQIYTQAEYQDFERRRLDELRYLQERGLVDAHGRPMPGAHHQLQQYHQQQAYQQQQGFHHQQQQYQQGQQQYYPPGQMPQGHPQPSQGYHPGQIPQQGYPQQAYQAHGQGQFQAPQGQFQPPQGHAQAPSPSQAQFQAQAPQQPAQVVNVNQGQAPPVQQSQPSPSAAPAQGQQHQAQGQPQQVQGLPQQAQGQPQQAQGQPQQVQGQAQGQPQQAQGQPQQAQGHPQLTQDHPQYMHG